MRYMLVVDYCTIFSVGFIFAKFSPPTKPSYFGQMEKISFSRGELQWFGGGTSNPWMLNGIAVRFCLHCANLLLYFYIYLSGSISFFYLSHTCYVLIVRLNLYCNLLYSVLCYDALITL